MAGEGVLKWLPLPLSQGLMNTIKEELTATVLNDVASEKFDRAMGSINTEEDPNLSSDADALLAELAPKPVTA